MKIAIIGAGLSACNLYNLLNQEHEITIFEKSRGTGGRLSTKYFDDKFIDHGTPYIKTQDKEFEEFLKKYINKDILIQKGDTFLPKRGMNKLCSSLINKDDLKANCKITHINKPNNKWSLEDKEGNLYLNFDFLIFTMPSFQILEFENILNLKIKTSLKKIEYESIATLILSSNKNEKLDIKKLQELNIFKKIINNSEKYNYHEFSSYVLHLSDKYLKQNRLNNKEQIFSFLYKDLEKKLGRDLIKEFEIKEHYWKFAFAKNYLESEFLIDDENFIGICGDYFQRLNLESSFHSSNKLAKKILTTKNQY